MDTAGYLKKHGWRGTGHSLDHTDRGIVKPLQISKKVDFLGVGVNKYAAVSDQWWMRAYDQGLKDLGNGKESALATAQKHGVNRGGLYARFVKGMDIPGTIGQHSEQDEETSLSPAPDALASNLVKSRKRKSMATGCRESLSCSQKVKQVDRRARTIKQQIKAFIDEATQQGILPTESTTTTPSVGHIAPDQQDMEAVLRLARLPNRAPKETRFVEREKLVRNLRRAALKYLESRTIIEPV